MNKTFRLLCLSTASLILASCGTNSSSLSSSSQKTTDSTQITSSKTGEGTSATSSNQTTSSTGTTTSVTPIPSIDIPTSLEETKGDDFISTEDGSLTIYENVYTIVAGGTYTVTGTKEAQIRVNAPEGEVELDLADAHISYAYNSPIYCYEAASLDISAKSGTSNSVTDLRGVEAIEDEYQGNGAIYSKVDLKLKGSGTLDVTGTYNNGVHSTKDLTVQKLTLHVTAPNNALKGNDSVTIKSGTLNIVSTGGDGIKTTDSDISSKEKQRGTVSILDGAIDIYSACDGIDASYNVEVSGGTTNIKTYKYSPYTGEIFANSTTDMYLRTTVAHSNSSRYSVYFYDDAGNFKWSDASFLKSENVQEGGGGKGGGSTTTYNYYELERPANFGNFKIYSFASNQENSTEDYLACSKGGTINQNYDTVTFSLNNGSISIGSWTNYEAQSQGGKGGEGNSQKSSVSAKGLKADNEINVTAGTINIESGDDGLHANNGTYLENEQTGLGDVNISGGTITVASDDDGLHADRYLNISGGTINVTKSYEGLEGNQIVFSGGNAYVYGSDDGVNAGNTGAGLSPKITVSGGLLFAAVPANGDTDGVDSNGDIELSGGTLIACGPTGNAMASAFDADGKCSMTGQSTLILFGGSEKVPSLASGISKSTKSGSYSSGKAYTIAYNEASFVSGKLISGYSSITSYSYFGAVTSVAAV